jgi:hypothetical protein
MNATQASNRFVLSNCSGSGDSLKNQVEKTVLKTPTEEDNAEYDTFVKLREQERRREYRIF